MTTLTRKDLLFLFEGMNSTADLQGAEFSFAIAVNIKKIQPEVEALQAMLKPSEQFAEFSTKRDEILKKYGTPIAGGNQYTIPEESRVSYDTEVSELEGKHKKLIEERKKQEEEYLAFIEKESSVDLCMVAKSDIPKSITPRQVFAILPMIVQ